MQNEPHPPVYDVSEAASLLGVPTSALRFYDKQGLVSPRRNDAGYRIYSTEDIVRLTDVILLRDSNVPVKTIKQLFASPLDEMSTAIDEATDTAVKTLNQVSRAIAMLSFKSKAIRTFYVAETQGPHIVKAPGIQTVYPFDIDRRDSLRAYLDSPQQTGFALYFEDARVTERYTDCSSSPSPGLSTQPIWTAATGPKRYVEFPLKTEYYRSGTNNLAEAIVWMEDRGLEPGRAVARYLTFDQPDSDETARDYYLCWVEIREDDA